MTLREHLHAYANANIPYGTQNSTVQQMVDEAVRFHEAEMQEKEEAHAKTESELGLLLAARREAHIRLGQYGIRSHYFIGEDPRFPQGKECSVVDRINLMAEALEQARKRIENLQEVLATAVKQTSDANLRSVEAEREAADLRAENESLRTLPIDDAARGLLREVADLHEKLKALEEENAKLRHDMVTAVANVHANDLTYTRKAEARAEKAEKALRDLLAYFERMVAATCPGEHDIEPDCKHGLDGLPEVVAARSLLSDSSQPSTEQEEQ